MASRSKQQVKDDSLDAPEKEQWDVLPLDKLKAITRQLGSLQETLTKMEKNFNKYVRENEERVSKLELRFTELEKNWQKRLTDEVDLVHLTLKTELSEDEAMRVLSTASPVVIRKLQSRLSAVFIKKLEFINCISLFKLSQKYNLDDLCHATRTKILKEFIQISEKHEDFGTLSLEDLKLFAFSDDVSATEEHILSAITRWIRDNPGHKHQVSLLLSAIRLDKCSLRFLKKLEIHFLVQEETAFLKTVQDRIQQITSSADKAGKMTRDVWRGAQDVFFVFGGHKSDGIVETFNGSTKKWVAHKFQDAPNGEIWTASVNDLVLVLESGNKRFRSFNPTTKQWTQLEPLPASRGALCVAQKGTLFYAMGGSSHVQRCDCYDTESNTWKTVSTMKEGRTYASATALEGLVYCSGGTGSMSSMEVYDPKSNSWSAAPAMGVGRSYHCLVSCGKFLWAVGGHNGKYLAVMEKYDPKGKTWSRLLPMTTPRGYVSATFCGELMYVTGGWGVSNLSTVEVYDTETNQWTTCESLSKVRYWHASCVVKVVVAETQYDEPLDV